MLNIVKLGIKSELEENDETTGKISKTKSSLNDIEVDVIAGLDFDYESDKIPTTADASQYETCYVTSHKAPCRAAAFDPTGSVIATGSVDASIKILDVERMLLKSSIHETTSSETPQQAIENHPVIRTLYDHADEITTLEFHPFGI